MAAQSLTSGEFVAASRSERTHDRRKSPDSFHVSHRTPCCAETPRETPRAEGRV
ncbi:unnamed protein product [Ixodes persulcatus]